MKFYNRKNELAELTKLTISQHICRLTVITDAAGSEKPCLHWNLHATQTPLSLCFEKIRASALHEYLERSKKLFHSVIGEIKTFKESYAAY